MSRSLSPIDLETGQLRAGFKTTVAALAVVFMGGAAYAAFATKNDIVEAVKAHTADEFPHDKPLEAIKATARQAKEAAQAAQHSANAAQAAAQRTDRQVWALNAKIEFLVESELEKARGSPQGRQRARRAATAARDRAAADAPESEASEDPLGDLNL